MKRAARGLPVLVLSLSLMLAGCATPLGQPLGRPLAQVTAELGAPTARYALPGGGVRLQYSQQPEGRHVYNLDFDAAGHLLRREDAMQPRAFEAIEPGRWRRADLEQAFGPPAMSWRVARSGEPVWSGATRRPASGAGCTSAWTRRPALCATGPPPTKNCPTAPHPDRRQNNPKADRAISTAC